MTPTPKWTTAQDVIKNAQNIAFYGRVSTGEQELDGQQVQTVQRYLEKFNKIIANDYDDGDVGTAYSKPYTKRSKMRDLLDDLESGKYDALIVSDRDRLSRQIDEHYLLREKFNELDIPVVIASQNDLYTSTESFLKNLIEDALTKMESDNISVRTKAALRTMLQKEMYIGGHPPFGYEMLKDDNKDEDKRKVIAFVENVEKLSIVREMFSDYKHGGTFTSITNQLKRKYPGTTWTVTKVRSILLNPIYAGVFFYNRYEYKGKKRSFKSIDQWIALPKKSMEIESTATTLEDWWYCWQKYEFQKDKPPRYFDTSFYFNDLISCSCGTTEKLVGKDGRTSGKKYGKTWYLCRSCKVKIPAEVLHTKFFNLLFCMPRPDDLILRELKQDIQKKLKTIDANLTKFHSSINTENKNLELLKQHQPDYKEEDLLLKELKEEVIAYYLSKTHSDETVKSTQQQIRTLEKQAIELKRMFNNDSLLEEVIAAHFTTPNWRDLENRILRNIALFIVDECRVLNKNELLLKIKSLSPEMLTLKR